MFGIVLAALALLLILMTVRAVARDGYGSNPPPRSHRDPFDPRLPVR